MHAHPTAYQVYVSNRQRGGYTEAKARESELQDKRAVAACGVCESLDLPAVRYRFSVSSMVGHSRSAAGFTPRRAAKRRTQLARMNSARRSSPRMPPDSHRE
jgi:hypothetical protein